MRESILQGGEEAKERNGVFEGELQEVRAALTSLGT